MRMPASGWVAPIVLLGALIATDVWVFEDAKAHEARGRPVVVSLGSFRLESPAVWGVACLLLWIFFFPLYVTGRKQA